MFSRLACCCPTVCPETAVLSWASPGFLTWLLGDKMEHLLWSSASLFFFPSVVAKCTPTGMLDSCSSRFFSGFKLGDTWTLHGLVVEGTEGAFIFHLETCVHFKLECKLGIFNGFSLAGQSNSSHRGVEVIFICESRRCRAELQRVPLVKREPCWQCRVESGALPRLLSVTSATNAR